MTWVRKLCYFSCVGGGGGGSGGRGEVGGEGWEERGGRRWDHVLTLSHIA